MDVLAETARALLDGGPVILPTSMDRGDWVSGEHDAALARLDGVAREDAPGRPPALDLAAARWALGRLAHLAQRVVARADDAATVEAEFQKHRGLGAPGPAHAESVWSVDLALRHLESIERAARGLIPADPLRIEIWTLARDWPFSAAQVPRAAGCESDSPAIPECVQEHPSLRRMYLDRVTAAQNVQHGQVPWVTAALSQDCGRTPGWLAPRGPGLSSPKTAAIRSSESGQSPSPDEPPA